MHQLCRLYVNYTIIINASNPSVFPSNLNLLK